MYQNKQAFTLIELLVVVLIIGILAAVALPQYQLAVEKAHASEAITQVKALADAEKVYYLANGEYTNSFADLDIDFLGSNRGIEVHQNYWYLSLGQVKNIKNERVFAARTGQGQSKDDGRWYIVYSLTDDTMYCEAHNADSKSMNICKTFGKAVSCPYLGEYTCFRLP